MNLDTETIERLRGQVRKEGFVELSKMAAYVCFWNDKTKRYPKIRCQMTDLDVLQRLQSLIGGKIYQERRTKKNWKISWTWQLAAGKEVKPVLEAIKPLMGLRRQARIQELLDCFK